MPSPRIARLSNDYAQLRMRFDGHPYITVEPVGAVPPEKYQLVFNVPSLRLDDQNRPTLTQHTLVTLTLPSGYPKEKPHAVAHQRVFHPNFGDYICIADFWSPAQSLAEIVLDIGEMLQWKRYNIQSPLNAIAANWAVAHGNEIPVGTLELSAHTGVPSIRVRAQSNIEE